MHTLTLYLCHCIVQVLFSAHSNIVFASLHCAGSKDAFHCYGASLRFCTVHAPALMEVCACMCSLNSFPLICTTGMKNWE